MNLKTSETHKECPKCKIIKDRATGFYQTKGKSIKVSGYCKSCILESNADRRRDVKQQAIDYLGGECSNCGYNKCNAALEFHHLDPNEKDISYLNNRMSFTKLKLELDKCVLLCANCHREHHSSNS
jgi:hypothetical protein